MNRVPDRAAPGTTGTPAKPSDVRFVVHRIRELRVVRYFMAALSGATVDFSVFAALVFLAQVHYLLAGLGSFLVSTLVNYLVSVRIVFQAGVRFPRAMELLMVYAVSATGLAWHQLILFTSVSRIGMHVMLAKILATGIVFFWNYWVRRRFVFTARR